MFEDKPQLRRTMLASLLSTGLLVGTAGLVMSAKAIVTPVHADCGGLSCTSGSDCLGSCFCNNPYNNSSGSCYSN
jgi:hypothetical protein